MFDRHILKFDIYFYNVETPVIRGLLHYARKHKIIIHRIKKTGTFVYSFKIIIHNCPKKIFLEFVEDFLDWAKDNINHVSFK